MFLIFALFGAATRSTNIAAALPLALEDVGWIPPSFTGNGEAINCIYSRADTNNSQNLRTISDIIWSCLATVFACSWVSVHPSIPSPQDSDFSIFRRRMGLLFWAIVAPELLIIWAMRQWIEARKIGKKYRSHGWTNVHGHFLVMGGFMLYEDDEPKQTLSIVRFNQLLKNKSIDFPLISKKEILDRSKGDLLSKSIIIVQVAWFAVQCMARHSQGLVITELELVTLAFTTLNGAMYFFWWDKPLDVRTPFKVPLKKPLGTLGNKPGFDAPMVESNDEDEQNKVPLMTRMHNAMTETMHSFYHTILYTFMEITAYVKKRGIIHSIWRIFIQLPIKNILYGFGNIIESDTSQSVTPGALRVPMFYAPEISADAIDATRLVAAGLGIVFGAIHLAAWSGEFPTHGARTAWCVASLIVTTLPSVIFIVKLLSKSSQGLGYVWDDCCEGPLFVVEFLTGAGGILVYVPSRFALFVIAFYCLKSVPPSGFQKTCYRLVGSSVFVYGVTAFVPDLGEC